MIMTCPNPNVGAEDVEIHQQWTHDYPRNPADRSRVWTVTGMSRLDGIVWLTSIAGFDSKRVGIGSLLAYWTKVA